MTRVLCNSVFVTFLWDQIIWKQTTVKELKYTIAFWLETIMSVFYF